MGKEREMDGFVVVVAESLEGFPDARLSERTTGEPPYHGGAKPSLGAFSRAPVPGGWGEKINFEGSYLLSSPPDMPGV